MSHDTLVYHRGEESREADRIEFNVPPNLTIKEFKLICRRLALSLGYSTKSVTKEFGKDRETGNDKQLKLLFD